VGCRSSKKATAAAAAVSNGLPHLTPDVGLPPAKERRMAKKQENRSYEEALQWFRDHGFDLLDAPGTTNRVFLKKLNCSAAIEKAPDAQSARIFAYPGYLVGGEIAKLINRGYQQFLKTTKNELPATADKLQALHQFVEEFKEGLGLPSLYNESLGTTSEGYVYDRVANRDLPEAKRPKRPWEQPVGKQAKRRA
jgi:hypothetical protein